MAANVIEIMPGVWEVKAQPMEKEAYAKHWAELMAIFEEAKKRHGYVPRSQEAQQEEEVAQWTSCRH